MSIFKIKRKLHPDYPDHIPALKLMNEEVLVKALQYKMVSATPVVIVYFKDYIPGTRKTMRSYKWDGNVWKVMGET